MPRRFGRRPAPMRVPSRFLFGSPRDIRMPQSIHPGTLDRLAIFILAATLFLTPLVHGSTLSDPFALPKWIVMIAAAILLAGTAIASHLTEDGSARLVSPALWN